MPTALNLVGMEPFAIMPRGLLEFAERLNIPVANTFMGKGVIPYTHPLAFVECGFATAGSH
jgi:acetolactate synthase, large subunit (EC 2.2.1.6)